MPSEDARGGTATLVVLATLAVTATTPLATSAHPPTSTDHGVSERTFHRLWSGDHDVVGARADLARSDLAIEELADGTDVPLDAPPDAVAQWNRGDHREFPITNRSVSVHPPNATLADGRFIKDAHATIFTVQPATRARVSPTYQPLYVAHNGTLLGTVDYRVVVPPDSRSDDRRVSWRLESHRINETRLLVDGRVATNASGTRTPALAYALSQYGDQTRSLTLEAEITVELRKEVETCTDRENGTCTNWRTSVEYPTENVTARDTIDVVGYDVTISGFVARYPNGDLGLVVYKDRPWLGVALPNGDVRGVWRFYAARDEAWDTLVASSETGESAMHSPLHPLRTTAYPIETGPTPTPRQSVHILDVYGSDTTPPTLPSAVHLDALEQPYVASYGIATRAATTRRLASVRAWGLVRGVTVDQPPETFASIPIHRSTLTLTVANATDATVTVRVELRDRRTGAPIATAEREGYVVLDGRRVNTSADGTHTHTLAHPMAGVSARYVPGPWWHHRQGYTADSDTVLVQGTVLAFVGTLYRIGVPVALFLLAGFIIDRITGWRLWPPWRRL